MEHIDGNDLAAYVENYTAENGYLSETEALRYIDQICLGYLKFSIVRIRMSRIKAGLTQKEPNVG